VEGLAPVLDLLLQVKFQLESGEPIRTGIRAFLSVNKSDFSNIVRLWFQNIESKTVEMDLKDTTLHQRSLLHLLEKGINGASVHNQLIELEGEILLACKHQLEAFVTLLPLKSMLPILLLLFPSFLILLIGPILIQLVSSLSF
jgi:hypothetical protein